MAHARMMAGSAGRSRDRRQFAVRSAAAAVVLAGTVVRAGTFNPIPLTASSFNQDCVVEAAAPQSGAVKNVTASMDNGTTNPANNTWYERGYYQPNPATGLPASGSTFISQGGTGDIYQMPSYVGPDVLLVGASGTVTTGTMSFSTPAAYTGLSFLTSSGNGPETLSVTVNYSNGTPSSTLANLISPDWFGSGTLAWDASGRCVPGTGTTGFNSVGSTNPNLWEVNLTLPDTTDPIASVTLTQVTGTGRAAIFAISGSTNAPVASTLTYTGTGTPAGSFDTTGSKNFQLGGNSAAFSNGSNAVFDDTATGTGAVTVQAAGVSPVITTFNNNAKAYSFAGGPVVGTAASFNGSGTVTFNDAVTFNASTTVNSGTVVVGSGGSLNSPAIALAGGTLVVTGTGTLGAGDGIADAATLTFNTSSATIGALTGTGTVNVAGTALTVGAGSGFNGTFAGTGNASLNVGGGTVTIAQPSGFAVFAGGVTVGAANGSAASLIFGDNGGSFGLNAAGTAPLTLTLGPSGTLTSAAGSDATFAGNIVLASSTAGSATIATGGTAGSNTLIVSRPITGTGPLALTGGTGVTTIALEAASTYTGETQLSGVAGSSNELTVRLDATNALSTAGGVAFTNPSDIQLDLNGHSQSVAYLRGASTSQYPITNNGGSAATLTVSSGTYAGGAATLGTPIADGSSTIAVVKAGAGNQVFAAASTYSGGTTIAGGTLTATNPSAFGNSNAAVTLNGGKLGLSGPFPQGPATTSAFANFQTNVGGLASGTAPAISTDNSTLTITSNAGGEGNSAFLKTPVAIPAAGFYANFTFQNTGGADGLTFVVQNDTRGAAAVGGTGGRARVRDERRPARDRQQRRRRVQRLLRQPLGTGFGTNGTITADTTRPPGLDQPADDPIPRHRRHLQRGQADTLTETDRRHDGRHRPSPTRTRTSTSPPSSAAPPATSGSPGRPAASRPPRPSPTSPSAPSASARPRLSIANAVVAAANTSSGIQLDVTPGPRPRPSRPLTLPPGPRVALAAVGDRHGHPRRPSSSRAVTFAGTATAPTGVSTSPTTTWTSQRADVRPSPPSPPPVTPPARSTAAAASRRPPPPPTRSGSRPSASSPTPTRTGTQLYGSGTLGLFDGPAPPPATSWSSTPTSATPTWTARSTAPTTPGSTPASSANGTLTGWYNGDFNYDGKVDASRLHADRQRVQHPGPRSPAPSRRASRPPARTRSPRSPGPRPCRSRRRSACWPSPPPACSPVGGESDAVRSRRPPRCPAGTRRPGVGRWTCGSGGGRTALRPPAGDRTAARRDPSAGGDAAASTRPPGLPELRMPAGECGREAADAAKAKAT